jgi:hypothetical protein
MAAGVFVAGVKYNVIKGSLQVEDAIEERSICSVRLLDIPGIAALKKGQLVEVNRLDRDGVEQSLFKGVVEDAKASRPGPGSLTRIWDVKAVDFHYFADKRVAAQSYVNQTCGFIVNDLLTIYLAPEGVTAGTIETGPTIGEAIFNYIPVSQAIQQIADRANFWWLIDANKQLHFRARSALVAPWVVTAADLTHRPSLEESNSKYRNRQFIRGGVDTTDVQIENKKGDGATRDFPVGFPIVKVPTVKVNAATKTVGIKGVETGKDWYWNKGDPIVTQDRAGTVLTSTDTLTVEYQGQFPLVVVSEDLAEVEGRKAVEGGTGIVDHVEDDAKIDTRQKGFDLAGVLLQKYALMGRRFVFQTERRGLLPGQQATIDYSQYGLSNVPMLISKIDSRDRGDDRVRWTVTAVEGPWQGSWQSLFLNIQANIGDFIDLLSTKQEAVLTILASFSESWAWGELTAVQVFACPVPATTLLPSTSLLPC